MRPRLSGEGKTEITLIFHGNYHLTFDLDRMSLNQILKFRFEVRDLGEGVHAERIDGGGGK